MATKEITNDLKGAKVFVVPVVNGIARHKEVKARRAEGKSRRKESDRPDCVWHELLLSFATVGNSRGADGLIRNQDNYKRVTFQAMKRKRTRASRLSLLHRVLRAAKVRMPDRKADWPAENYDKVVSLGGPAKAKTKLLNAEGWELDRILYRFRDCIMDGLEDAEDLVAVRRALKEKTIPWEQVKRGLSL
jgi:hypothetical protein